MFNYSANTASGAGISSQVNSILTASYNGGTNSWASGVIYSTLANTNSTASYALGWSNNTTTSAVTVKVVLKGDANLDGTVNIYDLGIVLANYNKPGTWATGDFNYDGICNIYDLGYVLANYNKTLDSCRNGHQHVGISQLGRRSDWRVGGGRRDGGARAWHAGPVGRGPAGHGRLCLAETTPLNRERSVNVTPGAVRLHGAAASRPRKCHARPESGRRLRLSSAPPLLRPWLFSAR